MKKKVKLRKLLLNNIIGNLTMKKIILTFIFSVTISIGANVIAQSDYQLFNNSNDGFFNTNSDIMTYRSDDNVNVLPALPKIGSDCDQSAIPAPVGSGIFLLTGLGISYLTFKKKKNVKE